MTFKTLQYQLPSLLPFPRDLARHPSADSISHRGGRARKIPVTKLLRSPVIYLQPVVQRSPGRIFNSVR